MKAISALLVALFLSAQVVCAQASRAESRPVLKVENIHGLSSLAACKKSSLTEGSAKKLIDYYQFDYASTSGSAARVSVVAQSDAGRNKAQTHLAAFLTDKTQPTSKWATAASGHKVLAAVNGGYFNLSDGASASYVFWAGKVLADPTTNKALTSNPRLKKYLPQIFDRSELRIFKNEKSGEYSYEICRHSVGQSDMTEKLVGYIQGGPCLLSSGPDTGAETVEDNAFREAFLRHEDDGSVSDSIGVRRTAARTAVGITAEKRVILVSVAGPKQDEFSSGLNLASLAELLQHLGCVQALNFDGGTSTTMVVRGLVTGGGGMTLAADQKKINADYCMVVGRQPETLVKSTLGLVCD